MTDPVPADDATLFPKTAGERLREAREAQGLSLAEVASRTRVPLRQLEAIENNNFAGLPSVTYAVGFAKAYARAVGVDEVAVAREVRGSSEQVVRRTDYEAYEVAATSRSPSGGLVIGSIVAAAVLLIAIGLFYGTNLFRGGDQAPATVLTENETETLTPAPATSPTPAPVATGHVTLIATGEVWLRVYDATNKTLYQGTLKSGERYDVPADANGPQINVGRPDMLQVTLNGSAVAPLGDGRVAIKDVGISAAALSVRNTGTTPTPAPTATASPTAGDAAVPQAFRTPAQTTRRPTRSTTRRSDTASPGDTPSVVTPPPAAAPQAEAPTATTATP